MADQLEIEIRYLIKTLPHLQHFKSARICDVYFPEIAEHAILRARNKNGKYEMTKKTRKKQSSTYIFLEQTIDLSKEEFDYLYSCSQRRIEKTRYLIPYQGLEIELDVFEGRLKGLIIAEVEFSSEKELKAFNKPEWLGKEVNDLEILANGVLSAKSFEDIKELLTTNE